MIEVELRGLLSEVEYVGLRKFLKAHDEEWEEDNKVAHYFNYSGGILKLVNELSKDSYKLSLKVGDEYSSMGMHETEVYLSSDEDYQQAKSVMESLGFSVKSTVHQERINAKYRDVFFSVKYTPSWGYHFEAEMLVEKPDEVGKAHAHIQAVAGNLGLKTMSGQELKDFIASID